MAMATMAIIVAKVHPPPTAVAWRKASLPSLPAPAWATARIVENSAVPAAPPNYSPVLNTALPSGMNTGLIWFNALVMMFDNPSE